MAEVYSISLEKRKYFFEAGAELNYLSIEKFSNDQRGISLVYPNYETKTFLANINLGLRVYSKKLLLRIGASPGVTKEEFIPGGYLKRLIPIIEDSYPH